MVEGVVPVGKVFDGFGLHQLHHLHSTLARNLSRTFGEGGTNRPGREHFKEGLLADVSLGRLSVEHFEAIVRFRREQVSLIVEQLHDAPCKRYFVRNEGSCFGGSGFYFSDVLSFGSVILLVSVNRLQVSLLENSVNPQHQINVH